MDADLIVGDVFWIDDGSCEGTVDHKGVFGGVVGFREVDCFVAFLVVIEAGYRHIQLAAVDSSHETVEWHIHPFKLDAHPFGDFLHQLDIEPGLVAGFIDEFIWRIISRGSDDYFFVFLDFIEQGSLFRSTANQHGSHEHQGSH